MEITKIMPYRLIYRMLFPAVLRNDPEWIFIGEIAEHPLDKYDQAVPETYETDEMNEHPQKPGEKTGEFTKRQFSQGKTISVDQ